jgi:hypothetical protein
MIYDISFTSRTYELQVTWNLPDLISDIVVNCTYTVIPDIIIYLSLTLPSNGNGSFILPTGIYRSIRRYLSILYVIDKYLRHVTLIYYYNIY